MKALVCRELSDDLSKLKIEDIELPSPGPGEVKLQMKAAPTCFQDYLIVQGLYQFKPLVPFTPGLEGAGVVKEIGEGVFHVAVGDEVVAGLGVGAFAQEALAAAGSVRKKPDALSMVEASCYFSAYLTAYVALYRRAKIEPGETLLVHGAAGGIGHAACDLGKVFGAKVIATASSEEKRAALRARGIEHVLDVTKGFREEVKALTGGRGADVIYDPVGGDVFDESTRCIAFDGRILIMGFASGRHATLKTNYALIKGYSVMGVRGGEYGRRFPEKGAENVAWVDKMAAEGKIKPLIGGEVPLEHASEAIAMMRDRKAIGKIVVTME
jgi:NADPH:quinone reductase